MFTNREFRKQFCVPCLGAEPEDLLEQLEQEQRRGLCRRLCCLPCSLAAKRHPGPGQALRSPLQPEQQPLGQGAGCAPPRNGRPHRSPAAHGQHFGLSDYGSFAQLPAGF